MKRHYREELLESIADESKPIPGWFPCIDCGTVFYTKDKRRNRNRGKGKCLSMRNGTQPCVTFKPDPKGKRKEQKG